MKVRSSLLPVLLAAFLVVLSLSHPAVASERGELVKDQENAARAAYLLGDYQRGAEILVKLFIQTRNSTYLYNQGRCYQQNHHWEEALDRFREYLRKVPKLEASAKEEVQQHIAECEANRSMAAVIAPSPSEPDRHHRRPSRLSRPSWARRRPLLKLCPWPPSLGQQRRRSQQCHRRHPRRCRRKTHPRAGRI